MLPRPRLQLELNCLHKCNTHRGKFAAHSWLGPVQDVARVRFSFLIEWGDGGGNESLFDRPAAFPRPFLMQHVQKWDKFNKSTGHCR